MTLQGRLKGFLAALRARKKQYDDAHNFTCDVCGREVFAGERVCTACRGTLPWNDGVICPICGRKVREEGVCISCKQRRPDVERARSVFEHEGEAARLVVRFKRGEKYLFRTLAELSLPLFEQEFSNTQAIVGVPMSEKALKKRGYNQSELYAARLAELAQKEFLSPVVKQRETAPQKFLGRTERRENLAGCFHVRERKAVRGKRVLIVDDTFTTGSTVSELAAVLKKAGAAEVCALTFTSVTEKNPYGVPPKPSRGRKKGEKGRAQN